MGVLDDDNCKEYNEEEKTIENLCFGSVLANKRIMMLERETLESREIVAGLDTENMKRFIIS